MRTASLDPRAYVQGVARRSHSSFTLSFGVLPRDQREAMTAVYAFCREVDDAVDDPGGRDPRALVAEWRREIARTYDGAPSRPLTRALAASIQRFHLTRSYFDGILTGVELDLTTNRYPTFEALSEYSYHVAGEVGLLCVEIFGFRSDRMKDYAVKTGLAFQLTNILRDVAADARQGRIYLPQEDLKRFGVSEEWIIHRALPSPALRAPSPRGGGTTQGVIPLPKGEGDDAIASSGEGRPEFAALMQYEADRAESLYREAAAIPTAEERPKLVAAEIMSAVYHELLKKIVASRFEVFGPRIRVSKPVKLLRAAQAWWRCR